MKTLNLKPVLFILILCLSTSHLIAQEVELGETKKVKTKYSVLYKKFAKQGKMTIPVNQAEEFEIHCRAGALELMPAEGNDISVDAAVVTHAISKKSSEKFVGDFLKLNLLEDDNSIYLKSWFEVEKQKKKKRTNEWGEEKRWNNSTFPIFRAMGTPVSKINLRVYIPKGLSVKVYDRSGWIQVKNLENDLYINDHSGKIQIENITGDLEIKDRSGWIEMEEVNGAVELKDNSGGISIRQAGGEDVKSIRIKDSSGGLWISNLEAEDVILSDKSGEIHLTDVKGDVALGDTSGPITLKNISGSLKITDSSGGIVMQEIAENSDEQIRISDKSGRIEGKEINSSIEIKDASGRISLLEVDGDVYIRDRSGGIDVKNISGNLKVRDRSGKINADSYIVKR